MGVDRNAEAGRGLADHEQIDAGRRRKRFENAARGGIDMDDGGLDLDAGRAPKVIPQ